jgi:hypothetical protein
MARPDRAIVEPLKRVLLSVGFVAAAMCVPALAHMPASTQPTGLREDASRVAALARLHRVYAPGRAYSLLLPSGWRFRDVSYSSDHATNLWWTPADPLARAVVVLSGCVGCVSTNNGKTPNPAGAVSDASTHRISLDELAFSGPYDRAEAGYDDNGLVIVTKARGRVNGYIRLDLWLPPSERSRATAILNSFRIS